jgi:hypothetical protein
MAAESLVAGRVDIGHVGSRQFGLIGSKVQIAGEFLAHGGFNADRIHGRSFPDVVPALS